MNNEQKSEDTNQETNVSYSVLRNDSLVPTPNHKILYQELINAGKNTKYNSHSKKQNLDKIKTHIQQYLELLEKCFPNVTNAKKLSSLEIDAKRYPLNELLSNAFKQDAIEELELIFAPYGIAIQTVKAWIE